MDLRARAWCFTINNYTPEHVDICKELKYNYIILGDEIGDNGTPHIQGYIQYKNAVSFATVKKSLPTAHIEAAKGTAHQNKVYCTKQNTLFEDGKIPTPGKRTDIEAVREEVQETGRMRDVVLMATSFQSIRIAEKILDYHERQRDWLPQVYWFYGKTGVGKSRAAREMFPDAYYKETDIKWWIGYDAHEDVIINEFRADFCKFHDLLNFLDRYPYRVEYKGGSRQFLAKNIVITSPHHPRDAYKGQTNECIEQLIRRIHEIRELIN